MKAISQQELLSRIQSDDPDVRTEAWLAAGDVGTAAIEPLSALAVQGKMEVGRAARRGIWKIVRRAATPEARDQERSAVAKELHALLADSAYAALHRDFIWMLSEIGTDSDAETIGALLSNPELREDARCALERIPGEKSVAALKAALEAAPDDFKPSIIQSLRARGGL
ncbi:MAG: hypothetical protein ACRD1R_03940 [Acidobacteriota bacterium]